MDFGGLSAGGLGFAVIVFTLSFCISCEPKKKGIKDLPLVEFQQRIGADLPIGTPKEDVLRFLEVNEIDCGDNSAIIAKSNEEFVTCVIPQKSLVYSNYKFAAEFFFDKQTKRLIRMRVFE